MIFLSISLNIQLSICFTTILTLFYVLFLNSPTKICICSYLKLDLLTNIKDILRKKVEQIIYQMKCLKLAKIAETTVAKTAKMIA